MKDLGLDTTPAKASSSRKVLRLLWRVSLMMVLFVLIAVATLAIYYSNLPWAWVRLVLALAFAAFALWALYVGRSARARWFLAGLWVIVVAWFLSIPPSHDRVWREEVAVMPRANVAGDHVHLTGVRNFEYRSLEDFDVHYEEREVLLSDLTSVDLFISYWNVGPIGHTFLSFNFENAPPVSISIETRTEEGEGYDPVASIFKGYELIYVVGDERDLVGSRTNHRDEEVFLYPVKVPRDGARRLFQEYLERINYLADTPEWYHLLRNNCTLNIVRYANAAGRQGSFDLRHLLNGWIDRYLYEKGLVDTSIPFDKLRQASRINDAAMAAEGAADFSARIRESLPDSRR